MQKQTKTIAFMLALTLFACVIGIPIVSTNAVQTYNMGDVNLDGLVNAGDAVLVLKYCVGLFEMSPDRLRLGDLNTDGTVNLADAVFILRIAVGLNESPGTVDIPEPTAAPTTPPTETPTTPPTETPTAPPTDTPSPAPTEDPTPTPTPIPEDCIRIIFTSDSIECDSASVTVDGSCATITAGGEYLAEGTLTDGRLIINAAKDDKIEIAFSGVDLSCSYDAPLYVQSADKVIVTLYGENSISDSVEYASESECKGAVHANDDLTINGTGSLTVTSASHNGIHCKNDLKISGGRVSVTALQGHGLRGNDSVTLKNNAEITINAGKDGIQTDNAEEEDKGFVEISNKSLAITAIDDAIQADRAVTIENAELDIQATAKGIKSDGTIELISGSGSINAAEDCINAASACAISGGEFTLTSGGDGLQTDTDLIISGGVLSITSAAAKGLNVNGNLTVSDGKIVIGGSGEDGINAVGTFEMTNGEIEITAGLDGIQADAGLTVSEGKITVNGAGSAIATTDDSGKGLKSDAFVNISGGTVSITAAEDAIHSDNSISISGGTLIVVSLTCDGIAADTDVNITGGNITVYAKGTDTSLSRKGIKGTASVSIADAAITVNSSDDAIHSDDKIIIESGTLTLTSGDDGIHADNSLTVNGGEITVPSCYEGIESMTININGGTVVLTASDDGINAADGTGSDNPPVGPGGPGGGNPGNPNSDCVITITDGLLSVNAGGDGVDSNGDINMSGGVLVISGSTNGGNSALDFDGTFTLTGGTVVACGAAGMVQYPNNTTVGTLNLTFSSTQSANQLLVLTDTSDNVITAFTPFKQYRSAVICSPQISKGSSYRLYTGGSYTGGTQTGGWCFGGSYSPGTLRKTITTSSSSFVTQQTI